MTWFRVDDKFAHHMKIERLRAACDTDALFTAAITVWTLMGSDCAGRSPSGTFSEFRLRQVVPIAQATVLKACAKLLEVGLFEPVEQGHSFHDFGVYNDTPEEAREKQSQREALSLARRAAGSKGGKQRVSNAQANGQAKPKQVLEANGQANSGQLLEASLARVPAGTGTGRVGSSENPEGDAKGGLDLWIVIRRLGELSRPAPSEPPRIELTALGDGELAMARLLRQLAAQGWALEHFEEWARLAASRDDSWWTGEYTTLALFGRPTPDPTTGVLVCTATGLLRCLEETRGRMRKRSEASARPRVFVAPTAPRVAPTLEQVRAAANFRRAAT